MTKKQAIQLFQERKVRTVWDDQEEKWYFCVVDVVEVLTDSKNPTDYIKKMRKRDPMLAEGWGQIVTPLAVQTAGGKQKTNVATMEGIFRIIKSIPSPKAEPFKQWMAQVASQRIDQMQDPELSIFASQGQRLSVARQRPRRTIKRANHEQQTIRPKASCRSYRA